MADGGHKNKHFWTSFLHKGILVYARVVCLTRKHYELDEVETELLVVGNKRRTQAHVTPPVTRRTRLLFNPQHNLNDTQGEHQ